MEEKLRKMKKRNNVQISTEKSGSLKRELNYYSKDAKERKKEMKKDKEKRKEKKANV